MYYFMDSATYEEVSIDEKVVGDKAGFFLEGMELSVSKQECEHAHRSAGWLAVSRVLSSKTCSVMLHQSRVFFVVDFEWRVAANGGPGVGFSFFLCFFGGSCWATRSGPIFVRLARCGKKEGACLLAMRRGK